MLAGIPQEIQIEILSKLKHRALNFKFSSGGCINRGGRLQTSVGEFFLKWNDVQKFPNMFTAEAVGLKSLSSASSFRIPEVILTGETQRFQFLLIEFINAGKRSPKFWEVAGQRLAALHLNTAPTYGFKADNYIGSLPQSNANYSDWISFFINERLEPQVKRALDSGKITNQISAKFNGLYNKLPAIISIEKPALLHGDLWSGNLMIDEEGGPCLIDPAVYYGHREAEVAFTKLFGGFDQDFYQSYHATYPLDDGFKSRIDLYNLYPLLVHLNIFGGGYYAQVVSILKHFV